MESVSELGDLTSKTVGDYRVLRRLGEGGMGQVYLSEQISLKRLVALKILKAELAVNVNALQRFKAEAEAVAKANHPNIVQVYAIGDLNGLPYMALEYVEGFSLRDYVAKKGPPALGLALSIMRQTAAGLQRSAELGIVHRDIKPDNILLTRKGVVKIADFGLSRCLAGDQPALNLTQTGVTMGTPLYMSPEQVQGKPLDPRSDIYSLGVTCYHMLTGNPPFTGQTAFEVAVQHVQSEPTPLQKVRPDLPAELCAVVHKMMAKNPDQRYQSARELLRDISRPRAGAGVSTKPETAAISIETTRAKASMPTEGITRWRYLTWWIVASIILALIAGACIGWGTRLKVESVTPSPGMVAETVEPVAKPSPIWKEREHKLWTNVKESSGPNGIPRPQAAILNGLQLAALYFDQEKWDDADRLFTWFTEQAQGRDAQTLGKVGHAMVLAFQDRAEESTNLLQTVCTARDQSFGRITLMINRTPQFLKWLVRALDYNAANLAGMGKSLSPELEALRKPRPLPARASSPPTANRPAGKPM